MGGLSHCICLCQPGKWEEEDMCKVVGASRVSSRLEVIWWEASVIAYAWGS